MINDSPQRQGSTLTISCPAATAEGMQAEGAAKVDEEIQAALAKLA